MPREGTKTRISAVTQRGIEGLRLNMPREGTKTSNAYVIQNNFLVY